MKKIIIANWKLNPLKLQDAQRLLDKLASVKTRHSVAICPPALYIPLLKTKFALGAQNIFWEESGAFTGEISGKMLPQFKVKYVLIGHSERRALGESDEQVNAKLKAALADKLVPVLCVGFGLERGESEGNTLVHLQHQLRADLHGISPADMKKIIVAYEPVWAIGGAHTEPPERIERTCMFIRIKFGIKCVLYGGSVTPVNAALLLQKEVDGFLIGHESLVAEHFKKIIQS